MTTGPQHGGPTGAAADVPKLGLIRPPLVYLASLVIGALIQFAMPLPFLPQALTVVLGVSLIVVARALLIRGCEIPGGWHARTSPETDHRDRAHGPLSLQPKSDLSGVLIVPARDRDLGQQRLDASHAFRGSGAHPLRRHTERRAVPGTEVRCAVLGL
jgi:hypothetical protein